MINGLQYGQNGSKIRTMLWCHALRPAQSPETMYALVPYGLIFIGPVHILQTIYGLKILKKSHDLVP